MIPKYRAPIVSPSRRLTPKEQALAEDIILAWTKPTINLEHHEHRKDAVRAQMPTLAKRLDALTAERSGR